MNSSIRKIFFLCLCFVSIQKAMAQGRIVYQSLNTGDSIVAEININTNAIYQRGKDNIPVETRLSLKKVFYIQAVSEQGYTIVVTTAYMQDSVNAVGQKILYKTTSNQSAQDKSLIAGKMKKILAGTDTLLVDRYGIITQIKRFDTAAGKELLPIMADLVPARLYVGASIGFFSSFTVPEFKNGAQWKDYRNTAEGNTTTDCNVFNVTDTTVIVRYSQALKGKYENKNANGIESINRQTGIVTERVIQSRSSAYELLKETLVFVNKSQAINENYTIISSKYN